MKTWPSSQHQISALSVSPKMTTQEQDRLPNWLWCSHMLKRLLCITLLLVLPACGEQQAAPPPKGRPPSPVKVETVKTQDIQRSVSLVGTVEPWKRSTVASEIEGLVIQFLAEEGMRVKKGQVLARLRTDTQQILLDSAKATLHEAKTRYKQAQLDLNRVHVLFEKELVTKKEHDDAIAQEAALRARVTQLDAKIREVEDRLMKSQIVAPFNGWVTKEFTEVGQWVQAGGAVIEIVDLSRLQVEVPLPERFVRDTRVGDPVSAVFDGLPDFQAKGRVFSVVAQADRVARTFPVKVEIPNPDLSIKSGMVARVTLTVGKPYQGIVVPKDALVLRGGKEFVFLVHEGTVGQVPVTSKVHLDDWVEVTGEIEAGMAVVVQGNERLLPGQAVRILEESTPS